MLRGSQVTQAPSSHGKSLGKAVDSKSAIVHARQGAKAVVLCWLIDDVLVDYFRQDKQPWMLSYHVCNCL